MKFTKLLSIGAAVLLRALSAAAQEERSTVTAPGFAICPLSIFGA
jgi:hypothetical protein